MEAMEAMQAMAKAAKAAMEEEMETMEAMEAMAKAAKAAMEEEMEAMEAMEAMADTARMHLGHRCFRTEGCLRLMGDTAQLGKRWRNLGRNYRRILSQRHYRSSYHIFWPAACRHPQPLNHQHL